MRLPIWVTIGVAGLGLALPATPLRAERPSTPTAVDTRTRDTGIVSYAGGAIRVSFAPAHFVISREELMAWVLQSARATATYFGRFPVTTAHIEIEPVRGAMVTMGRATGNPEPRIIVTMGRRTTAASLARESLLVHEMVHLGVPDHVERYLWLHEGLASYIEFVARAQAGLMTQQAMWVEFMREMPGGLPEPRDNSGLDGTKSHDRRYWGGALFSMLADIEIRRATRNRYGLQDALRAMQSQGGNLSRLWTLERTLDVGDKGTGTTVLSDLYRKMGTRPYTPDLPRLWRDLGLRSENGRVVFDDTATLAAIRRAISDAPSAPLLTAQPKAVRLRGSIRQATLLQGPVLVRSSPVRSSPAPAPDRQ